MSKKKTGPSRSTNKPPDSLLSIAELMQDHRLVHADLVIVGDGGGSSWDRGCGWGVTVVDTIHGVRQLLYGGMNLGSVNLAELMAYVHSLTWYHAKYGAKLLQRKPDGLRVHVITDSQTIVRHGNQVSAGEDLPATQRAFWAAMRQHIREGYQLHWHWRNRNTVYLNWVADVLATHARQAMEGLLATIRDENDKPLSPWEPKKQEPA